MRELSSVSDASNASFKASAKYLGLLLADFTIKKKQHQNFIEIKFIFKTKFNL